MSGLAMPRDWSYRTRLALGLVGLVTAIAAVWAWSLFDPLSDVITGQQRTHLKGIAQAGALALEESGRPLTVTLETLVADTDLRLTVVATDGRVLGDTEEEPALMEDHGDRPEIRAALRGSVGTDVRLSETQGVQRMYVAVPALYQGEPVALRVSESLASIEAISGQARTTGLVLLAVTVGLALLGAWRLAHAAAGPVERLAAAAAAMADGDLTAPVPADTQALEPLSEALSRLREQLRERIGELERQQQTLRLALNGLTDAVILLEDDRISFANRALGTLTKTPPIDVRGRTIDSLGMPAAVSGAILAHRDATPAAIDVGPDPFRRYHRVLIVPLSGSGTSHTLIVVADVTDRSRLDAMRRDFVANVSHELKTPTAGILLLAESAEHAASDGDAEQALAFVGQIRAEAARLRNMVMELLDLSRLDATPQPGTITDVRRSVELALAGHGRTAQERGLILEADLSAVAGEDVAVLADATDIAIALDNLLANAIAYTEAGRVTVRVSADDASVEIAVADSGVGIPASDLERVFERFYRVDRSRSRTSGGTGLGLSLVRHAAERWGGTVTLESSPGAGTTAFLRLPRAR